jgi:hypothetical protein
VHLDWTVTSPDTIFQIIYIASLTGFSSKWLWEDLERKVDPSRLDEAAIPWGVLGCKSDLVALHLDFLSWSFCWARQFSHL